MRINENTYITGEKVKLVPYVRDHVPLYHQWMGDETIRAQTASERLSLEEEYENQISWHEDPQKCTFIVLDRSLPDTPDVCTTGGAMAGDVNLFFNDFEDEHAAEVEVMIANAASRGKGCGKEAVILMMEYGKVVLHVSKFIVKIGEDNVPSLQMFKKLGFQEESFSDYFHEYTLVLDAAQVVVRESSPVLALSVSEEQKESS
eukprot:TRINITY_DN8951_c0_g1_i1.p1 TRINITY_DN8951_c0_g1~~TRINITY_DN8951_c0_g1_i1.p1  ORF type:complete len:203 (+),score=50.38 TRINITY_DN8951_c0_g1_i1:81-689(+)